MFPVNFNQDCTHTHTHTHTHTCTCVHTHTNTQVFDVLLARTNVHNPSDTASYPHICTLLEFDTREFLNVIALVCSFLVSTDQTYVEQPAVRPSSCLAHVCLLSVQLPMLPCVNALLTLLTIINCVHGTHY